MKKCLRHHRPCAILLPETWVAPWSAAGSGGLGRKVDAMVSIKEIAEVCKVSPGTVSKALSGATGVGDKTRERIARVAKRFGYLPNALVRCIQKGRSGTVAVAAGNVGDPWVALVMRGAFDRLERDGLEPVVFDWDSRVRDGAHILRGMRERRVDGLLMFPPAELPSPDYMAELRAFDRPIVLMDQTWPHLEFDFVGTDDAAGAMEAADHIVSLGHARIALLAYTAVSSGRVRLEAALERLAARGIAAPPAKWIAKDCGSFDSAYAAAGRWLAARSRPTAILCFNDEVALGALAAAADARVRVPGELSVIGFCDLPDASRIRPALTTVRQDPEAVGARAADLLVRRIAASEATKPTKAEDPTIRALRAWRGGQDAASASSMGPSTVLLPTSLVIRGTTGPAPTPHTTNTKGDHRP